MNKNLIGIGIAILLSGAVMLLCIMYWEVDVDNTYDCVKFYPNEDSFEKSEVIIKGKYGKSLLRGERFKGSVTVDGDTYPDMISREKSKGYYGMPNPSLLEKKYGKVNVIIQNIESEGKLKGFRVGHDTRSVLGLLTTSYGDLYFDHDMQNIVIYVHGNEISYTYASKPVEKQLMVSKENKDEAMKFISDKIPLLDRSN